MTSENALRNAKNDEIKDVLNKECKHYRLLTYKWNKRYKTFSQNNNLRTQMNRTKI